MCIRKLSILTLLLLMLSPKAFAGVAPCYEWQMSDDSSFSPYEVCGYGKEIVLTKALYGKYIRFVYTDLCGNTKISDIKGPVKYEGKNVIDFERSSWVVEDKDSEEHYVKCSQGRLWAVNPHSETVSDNAIITLPGVLDNADKRLVFKVGAEQSHQRMKLFFQNEEKETVFSIYVTRREDKLYILNDGSQFSTSLYKADIGDAMEVMLGFDFDNSKALIKNRLSDEWSEEIEVTADFEGLTAENIKYIKVSNEYNPCYAWLDDVRFLEDDTKNEQKRFGIWGQREPDGRVIAQLYNYSSMPVMVRVAAAFYDGEYLKDVKFYDMSINEDITDIEPKSDESYDSVKLFAWDIEEVMKPLAKAYDCHK